MPLNSAKNVTLEHKSGGDCEKSSKVLHEVTTSNLKCGRNHTNPLLKLPYFRHYIKLVTK